MTMVLSDAKDTCFRIRVQPQLMYRVDGLHFCSLFRGCSLYLLWRQHLLNLWLTFL